MSLNLLHSGSENFDFHANASLPQQHVQTCCLENAAAFLRGHPEAGGGKEIRLHLQQPLHYRDRAQVRPLGADAGVPGSAAQLNLYIALREEFPGAAAQIQEPTTFLLHPFQKPVALPRAFKSLDTTYAQYLENPVAN